MVQTFSCPDCKRVHVEPLEASYVLAVRCADCELEAALPGWRRIDARASGGRLTTASRLRPTRPSPSRKDGGGGLNGCCAGPIPLSDRQARY